MKQNGEALQYASEDLRADNSKKIVSEDLEEDRETTLAAVTQNDNELIKRQEKKS